MLFEPNRHEPLLPTLWDPVAAKTCIQAIVADLEETFRSESFWPPHPLDLDPGDPIISHKSVYFGAAGSLWALWYLKQEQAVTLRLQPERLIESVEAAYHATPDTGEAVPSYLLGRAGIQLIHWRLTGSPEVAARLHDSVTSNIDNPTNEMLWAAPGTMVAALHMYRWTDEVRWRDLFLANVEHVWRGWLPDETGDYRIWTQDLYGRIAQLIGTGHGFAGNVYPLLSGAALLSAERCTALFDDCRQTVLATAIVEGDSANWPPVAARTGANTAMLMQWCHGAPGMVTSLAPYPIDYSEALEAILLKAGEAIWDAGPLAKGPGLCHGTSGNGYAFLTLHRRTGDRVWLERARLFAMHAIAQYERMRHEYGRGRYSLWTGDPGLAVYLWHCLKGIGSLPGFDCLD